MPSYNLMPILFPKPKQDNVSDMLKTLMQIQERDVAIGEGGSINNPNSYGKFIKDCYQNANNSSTEKERNYWILQAKKYEQKQVIAAVDEVKETDVSSFRKRIEQDLRELEHTYTGRLGTYAEHAAIKFDELIKGTSEDGDDGLNQIIAILEANGEKVNDLKNFKDWALTQKTKYNTIVDAFESNDMEALNEFTVVYTPYSGKVGDINKTSAMRIVSRSESMPENSRFTDMKFIVKEGRIGIGSDEEQGMSVAFLRSGTSENDKIQFSNSSFEYSNGKWQVDDIGNFDYQNVKHAAFHDINPGDFARDSENKLYYVNRDKSFSRVSDKYKEELNFSEDKVFNLSPNEEMNILPGAIDSSLNPIQQRLEQEFEEAKEMKGPGFLETAGEFWKSLGPSGEIVSTRAEEFERKFVSTLPKRVETFGKSVIEAIKNPKGFDMKEPSKWEEPTTEPVSILEKSKKFIQGIIPQ